MEQFMALTGRNLKLYFRDRSAVFFSLLSMVIVICLMMFFLGDMNVEGIVGILGEFPGRDAVADKKNAELLVLSWTYAGIISINAVTVTMSVYSILIKDRMSGKLNSMYTSPISRTIITASYIMAAWLASVCVCLITLFVTEAYGVNQGLEVFSFITHIKLVGMIMLNSFVYAAIMYLVAMLAKTEGAWSGMSTVVGTLVGFLGGIYIPIGTLSAAVAGIMKCTPIIYGTAMFRELMTKDILDTTFAGIPDEIKAEYCDIMGISLKLFDKTIGITQEWLLLLLCGIMFLVIGVFVMKYGKKTDR